jgi:hypothetical protein
MTNLSPAEQRVFGADAFRAEDGKIIETGSGAHPRNKTRHDHAKAEFEHAAALSEVEAAEAALVVAQAKVEKTGARLEEAKKAMDEWTPEEPVPPPLIIAPSHMPIEPPPRLPNETEEQYRARMEAMVEAANRGLALEPEGGRNPEGVAVPPAGATPHAGASLDERLRPL